MISMHLDTQGRGAPTYVWCSFPMQLSRLLYFIHWNLHILVEISHLGVLVTKLHWLNSGKPSESTSGLLHCTWPGNSLMPITLDICKDHLVCFLSCSNHYHCLISSVFCVFVISGRRINPVPILWSWLEFKVSLKKLYNYEIMDF